MKIFIGSKIENCFRPDILIIKCAAKLYRMIGNSIDVEMGELQS
jgi:hypothetical protein